MRVEAVRLVREPLLLYSKWNVMAISPKVLVMIHSDMWSDSEKYLERRVRRLIESLYIRYDEKRKLRMSNHG